MIGILFVEWKETFVHKLIAGERMQKVEWMIHSLNQLLWGQGTVIFLLISGIWFWYINRKLLVYHPFTIFRGMMSAMLGEKGKQARADFYTALAGTLGIGSMIGVASAIALGGPGALIWMFVSGWLGMALKYAETTLACSYQVFEDHHWIGGTMILLGRVKHHLFLSVCFSLSCLFAAFGVGNMVPSAAICTGLQALSGCERWMAALIVMILVFVILLGKGRRIQSVNAKLLPFISLLYVGLCLYILYVSKEQLPQLLILICKDAIGLSAVSGGISGHLLSQGIHYGLTRGLFSHEAGMGSAPLAYASHRCEEPVEQGFLGMLEVSFDTFFIALLSGLVLLCAFPHADFASSDGALLMMECFTMFFGALGKHLFSLMMILFAFPTILGWYYYASQCLDDLFTSKWPRTVYLLLFTCSLFIGGILQVSVIWEGSDLLNGCMLLLNLFTLWMFQSECTMIGNSYLQRRLE